MTGDVATRIGQRLRIRRERRGLRLVDLAGLLNVHPSTLARFELGRSVPKLDFAARWAWSLGCRLSTVLEEVPC